MPPQIVHPPQETNRVLAGANLTLECVAQGAPVPLVTWEKFGGGQLPDGRASQLMGNLVIIDVREEDRGTYVCRAENGPGQATFKTALVEVFESPRVDSIADTVIKRGGDRIEIRCPIRGRPLPDVVWFKNGVALESGKNGHRITRVGDRSILNVEASESGTYQCYARNEYGSAQADVFVTSGRLLESSTASSNLKHPQIIFGPQNTTIYEGQTVVLLCVTNDQSVNAAGGSAMVGSNIGSGSGSTLINWLQNGLIIEPTLMRRFEINQLLGNLRIVSVQKSDAGLYKCIASNEFGMSTAEAYVTVKTSGGSSGGATSNQASQQRRPLVHPKPTSSPSTSSSNTVQSSRPSVTQIGADKILLRWQLSDSRTGASLDTATGTSQPAVAYFKVDYKTNSRQQQQQQQQHHQWLTIDEQIDPKKREYILTDLSRLESYRFRITTFFVNGELSHSHQSTRFRLDPDWQAPAPQQTQQSTPTSNTAVSDVKLADIQVQISQIWAISSSSLGLKWDIFTSNSPNRSTTSELTKHINGFYIYYRKVNIEF